MFRENYFDLTLKAAYLSTGLISLESHLDSQLEELVPYILVRIKYVVRFFYYKDGNRVPQSRMIVIKLNTGTVKVSSF